MRLLLVIDSLYTGGAEISSLQFLKHLKSKGHQVQVCKLQDRSPEYNPTDFNLGNETKTLRSNSLFEQVKEIVGLIREFEPDIVHSVLFKSNIRTRLAKAFVKFYHVESLVNCTYDPIRLKDGRISKVGFYLYKYTDLITSLRGVNHFIAITEEVKKHYQSKLKIPNYKFSVIYRGRKSNEYVEEKAQLRLHLEKELGIGEKQIILMHVGRQEFQKGHIILLKSLNRLLTHSPFTWSNIHVIFCGRQGNASPEIEAYLDKNNKLESNIHWLGHRQDIPQLLAASDIFVFPSLYEGLGGALIEAQSAALPIVCSDLPVFREVVNENKNALTFPVGDDAKFAEQLMELTGNASLRQSMGYESLLNFEKKFKLDQINDEMLRFYQRVSL